MESDRSLTDPRLVARRRPAAIQNAAFAGVGTGVGSALGGLLAGVSGYGVAFWVAGAVVVVALLVLLRAERSPAENASPA